jgi:hypothetical protein
MYWNQAHSQCQFSQRDQNITDSIRVKKANIRIYLAEWERSCTGFRHSCIESEIAASKNYTKQFDDRILKKKKDE